MRKGYECCAWRSFGQTQWQCKGRMVMGELFLVCTECGRVAEPPETKAGAGEDQSKIED